MTENTSIGQQSEDLFLFLLGKGEVRGEEKAGAAGGTFSHRQESSSEAPVLLSCSPDPLPPWLGVEEAQPGKSCQVTTAQCGLVQMKRNVPGGPLGRGVRGERCRLTWQERFQGSVSERKRKGPRSQK